MLSTSSGISNHIKSEEKLHRSPDAPSSWIFEQMFRAKKTSPVLVTCVPHLSAIIRKEVGQENFIEEVYSKGEGASLSLI